MYVCVCHAVTERQVRTAVEAGARSLGDLRERLCVGQTCGRCAESARAVLQEIPVGMPVNARISG